MQGGWQAGEGVFTARAEGGYEALGGGAGQGGHYKKFSGRKNPIGSDIVPKIHRAAATRGRMRRLAVGGLGGVPPAPPPRSVPRTWYRRRTW